MAINLTNMTAIDSFYDWGFYAKNATSGLFWGIILIALFIVMVTRLRKLEIDNAIAASCFACLVLSVIFVNLGFVQIIYPIAFALGLGGVLFYKRFRPTPG